MSRKRDVWGRLSKQEVYGKYTVWDEGGALWTGHADSEYDAYRVFLDENAMTAKIKFNRDEVEVSLWKV